MHDATEGGVIGGLAEVAAASEVGLRVDKEAIPIRPEVRAVCDKVGMDPYISISEGTLIATVRPEHVKGYLRALEGQGIEAAEVGEIVEPEKGRVLVSDGQEQPMAHPGLDPFWGAFGRWAQEAAGG